MINDHVTKGYTGHKFYEWAYCGKSKWGISSGWVGDNKLSDGSSNKSWHWTTVAQIKNQVNFLESNQLYQVIWWSLICY